MMANLAKPYVNGNTRPNPFIIDSPNKIIKNADIIF